MSTELASVPEQQPSPPPPPPPEPAFPLLTLYANHVPNIDTFWSTLFTQLAHKISPPGLNITGQTLFSMKASVVSATPGGSSNTGSTDIHVGSASIVSTSVTQQKLSVQRGHAKLSTLLMSTRGQLSLNKPKKGRLVSGSVAISEPGLNDLGGSKNESNIINIFPLKCSVSAQQFSVSLPTIVITSADVQNDPVLLRLVIESFQLLKRLIGTYTLLSSDTDVVNQSSQLVQKTEVMRAKIKEINRWCDLKSKMVKEELLEQYCLSMKEKHQLTWPATSELRTMIELALTGREHKSSDVLITNGVVTGVVDIEYDAELKRFVNRRWSQKKASSNSRSPDKEGGLEDADSESDTDTESQLGDDDHDTPDIPESTDTADTQTKSSTTALTAMKLMSKLEPSPLVAPHHTMILQKPGKKRWVAWDRTEKERLKTHHDIGRNGLHTEKVDLIHAYERMVISYNR